MIFVYAPCFEIDSYYTNQSKDKSIKEHHQDINTGSKTQAINQEHKITNVVQPYGLCSYKSPGVNPSKNTEYTAMCRADIQPSISSHTHTKSTIKITRDTSHIFSKFTENTLLSIFCSHRFVFGGFHKQLVFKWYFIPQTQT